MTPEVLIFLHMDDPSPGYIADFLTQHAIPYRLLRCYRGEPVPSLDQTVLGLVFMGGVMSANDNDAWLLAELALISQALDQDIPVLGHCLGGQLISKALGASITQNAVAEVGWHHCYRHQSAHSSSWLEGLPDPFTMFHWHYETFSLPAGADHLFCSQHCANQAYSIGDNVLAMQCHVEMTLPLVTDWINNWQDQLQQHTCSQQTYQQIRQHLNTNITALNQVADRLYTRWMQALVLEHR